MGKSTDTAVSKRNITYTCSERISKQITMNNANSTKKPAMNSCGPVRLVCPTSLKTLVALSIFQSVISHFRGKYFKELQPPRKESEQHFSF